MAYNDFTTAAYFMAIRLMFSGSPVNTGIRSFGAFLRNMINIPVWGQLDSLSYEDDLPALEQFIKKELPLRPRGISILYFGLSDMGSEMSLGFLRQVREPNPEWIWEAYDANDTIEVPSGVLQQIQAIGDKELPNENVSPVNADARWIVETCYPLVFAGLSVRYLFNQIQKQTLLGEDHMRRVAVFFSEGDDFFLGKVTNIGFTYEDLPEFLAST